jgi:alpha-D-xyloside xylohydrolase
MVFSDGFWLTKNGYNTNYMAHAYEIITTENAIKILATPVKVAHRGMTLAGPNLEITYSSTAENIIKVNIVHYKGFVDHGPHFSLHEKAEGGTFLPTINNTDDYVELITGSTAVRITKETWQFAYTYEGKLMTDGGWRSTSIIEEAPYRTAERLRPLENDTFFAYPADKRNTFIREQLSLSAGEYIYGFGEKFTPFIKNGQTIEIWNSDGGTCTPQSYKSIPFYVSSRGYGVFVNTPDRVSYETASDTVSKVSFTVQGEELEYFILGSDNIADTLRLYTGLTGRPALPPAFTFGLWLTTSFTTTYNEETITSFIDGMADRDIPLQVFHFDCFWMKEYELCNMEWNLEQFPDPKAMLGRLKDKGLSSCVWINPYVAQRSKMFEEGQKNGYFIKKSDGSVFQTDLWQPGMAIIDFTNPSACTWYTEKLRMLCEMGVDTFKTDFAERIPTTDIVYYDSSDPIKMHNYYTYIYNKCVFTFLESYYGKNKACLFARSATVGGQQFPVHWGGDCSAAYSSMAETLRGGLSLCLSGFGFFSHDISGFEDMATPDIYKRWAAFGLLSSHSRLHGSSSYRVPWLFDEESCDVLRFFTKLKGRLMPYIFAQAVHTNMTGIPMMRAMVIDYASDLNCLPLDRQYLLGDSLLVAPILNADSEAEYYIPRNTETEQQELWTDIITGKQYEAGKWYRHSCTYMEMPILAKPNSILAFGAFARNFEYDYLTDTEFVIYNLAEGKSATCTIYNTEAEKVLELTAFKKNDQIKILTTGFGKYETGSLPQFKVREFGRDTLINHK